MPQMYFLMVCLYTVLLMLIFLIPDKGIQVHRDEAIGYINKVGYYPNIFFDSSSAKMDNLTDEVMLQITSAGSRKSFDFRYGSWLCPLLAWLFSFCGLCF